MHGKTCIPNETGGNLVSVQADYIAAVEKCMTPLWHVMRGPI